MQQSSILISRVCHEIGTVGRLSEKSKKHRLIIWNLLNIARSFLELEYSSRLSGKVHQQKFYVFFFYFSDLGLLIQRSIFQLYTNQP